MKSSVFKNLYSLKKAADLWGIDDSDLRHAIKDEKLIDGVEVKKSCKQWVITKKCYGPFIWLSNTCY